jgi:endonuclease/exonuclease/phosphatase family metal-dependent hydrolase
LIVFI